MGLGSALGPKLMEQPPSSTVPVTMADTLKSIVLAIRCSTLKDTQCFPPEHWSKPVCHMVHSPNYNRAKMYIPFICPEGIS